MDKEAYRQYLLNRKKDRKDYYGESVKAKEQIRRSGMRPKLLLHACCGPCAGFPLEFLSDVFDVTIYYNNSNIYPQSEFERRRDELIRLTHTIYGDAVEVIVPPYDNISYTAELAPMKDDPEGWTRCFFCYEKRMREGFRYAEENGFPFFTTVMTISRQKDSRKLNEIGLRIAEEYPSVTYFVSDFKKKGGQVRRDEIVREYGLYAQDYCGCVYSYVEAQKRKQNT
ncbi:MAG: epoxyqueuosine reductase QueH [Solobacterium sp.]|nr:epoxyqueuosine reductase QueH [Solobacterium sp.]